MVFAGGLPVKVDGAGRRRDRGQRLGGEVDRACAGPASPPSDWPSSGPWPPPVPGPRLPDHHPTRRRERTPRARSPPAVAGAPAPDGLGASSLPSQIAELLEEAIIVGELVPGQRLRGDDLAATYGVSRIPVREALRTLEAGGWVEIRPRYGAYVRSHSAVELAELFEVRAMGKAYAARCAATRRTADELPSCAHRRGHPRPPGAARSPPCPR